MAVRPRFFTWMQGERFPYLKTGPAKGGEDGYFGILQPKEIRVRAPWRYPKHLSTAVPGLFDGYISTGDTLLGTNYGAWGSPGFMGTFSRSVYIPRPGLRPEPTGWASLPTTTRWLRRWRVTTWRCRALSSFTEFLLSGLFIGPTALRSVRFYLVKESEPLPDFVTYNTGKLPPHAPAVWSAAACRRFNPSARMVLT